MMRKSCATHLEAMGVPRSVVSRILRHSGEAVTEHFYLRRDEQAMVDAVKDVAF
jgi:integrase